MQHFDVVVVGYSIAGRSFRLETARRNRQDGKAPSCLYMEAQPEDRVAGKSCGSLLTTRARQLFQFPETGGVLYPRVNVHFGEKTQLDLELGRQSIVITSRERILDRLDYHLRTTHDRSPVWYDCQVKQIDFDSHLIHTDRPGEEEVHYDQLVLACGAWSQPVRWLANRKGVKWDEGLVTYQTSLAGYGDVPPTVWFDSQNLGGGYFWTWWNGENLNSGIILTPEWLRRSGFNSRADERRYVESQLTCYLSKLGVNPSGEHKCTRWSVPDQWRGLYQGQGVYTIGDAAGAAFYPNGEGMPQAYLTARAAARQITQTWPGFNPDLAAFLWRKRWLQSLASYRRRSTQADQQAQNAFRWAIRCGGTPCYIAKQLFGL